MIEIAIKLENLSKIYKLYNNSADRLKESLSINKKIYHKDHYALNNISFEIKKGETVGIIGVNGSGKSTMLKIITGVLTPSSGNVVVNGKISALLELGAGFNPEYTGIENIYLNGTMMGYTKSEMDSKLNSILEFADIGEFISQPVKTYSSGMFARLAFAVAINVDPDILIVDEALSVGDVFFQAKCYNKFSEFMENGKTILFVSHDLGSIIKYCSETIILNKGELISKGKSIEMIDIYKKILVNQYNPLEELKSIKNINDTNIINNWKYNLQLNPDILDYGNGKAKIIDFAVIDDKNNVTNNILKGTTFTVKMHIEFFEDVKDPIYAFTIKDLKGTDITGTNTLVEKVDTGYKYRNDKVIVSFTQNMNLQGGSYLLSLGCTGFEGDGFTVYNRLYDACIIGVISDKNTVGLYDIDSTVQIY